MQGDLYITPRTDSSSAFAVDVAYDVDMEESNYRKTFQSRIQINSDKTILRVRHLGSELSIDSAHRFMTSRKIASHCACWSSLTLDQ